MWKIHTVHRVLLSKKHCSVLSYLELDKFYNKTILSIKAFSIRSSGQILFKFCAYCNLNKLDIFHIWFFFLSIYNQSTSTRMTKFICLQQFSNVFHISQNTNKGNRSIFRYYRCARIIDNRRFIRVHYYKT